MAHYQQLNRHVSELPDHPYTAGQDHELDHPEIKKDQHKHTHKYNTDLQQTIIIQVKLTFNVNNTQNSIAATLNYLD